MEPQGEFGFKEVFTHVVRDMAAAISERFGESKQQQFVRAKVAAHMILALRPRDVLEAMLAGQSVMLHAILTDAIHDLLQGQVDVMRRGSRSNIVALNRAFHMNVDKLEQYHVRPSTGIREASGEAQAKAAQTAAAATPPMSPPEPVETPAAKPASTAAAPPVIRPRIVLQASPEAIAECRANPEAMAALEAGDAERFARALGIENPSKEYLAAAAGLPANGHAAGNRPEPSDPARTGGPPAGNGHRAR